MVGLKHYGFKDMMSEIFFKNNRGDREVNGGRTRIRLDNC